jgi:hypothetical protein
MHCKLFVSGYKFPVNCLFSTCRHLKLMCKKFDDFKHLFITTLQIYTVVHTNGAIGTVP